MQLVQVDGFAPVAVADSVEGRAEEAYTAAGVSSAELASVDTADEVTEVVEDGRRALLTDGDALAAAELDVIVESTGDPVAGARHAFEAIQGGTHVVTGTVEADATVGPFLADLAASRGVVYTMAYGDQPALIAELVAWARTVGLDVVAAGRGIGSYDANAAIELCAAANATGLPPDADGLHVPTVGLEDVPEQFRPTASGGCLSTSGVVDGAVSPADQRRAYGESIADGVFVVVTAADDDTRAFIQRKNRAGAVASADGDHVAFFRPHHLPGSETPVSVAAAANGQHTGVPVAHIADVVATADRRIEPGTTVQIDYPKTNAPITAGLERAETAVRDGQVPFALLDGAEFTQSVDAGEPIRYGVVDLEETFLRHFRAIGEGRFG
ncbi:hypothetical protein [Haloarchaeobius sp. TZWSO28]|uniref:hypothetical protein n=1 Tax=Haloarchaeobius sp. TZWSO28 TaxID=3446119 RepID=UPI003EBE8FD5